METTQPATPARVPRKGKKSGPVTEYLRLVHDEAGARQGADRSDRGGPGESRGGKGGVCEHRRSRRQVCVVRQRHAASHHDQLRQWTLTSTSTTPWHPSSAATRAKAGFRLDRDILRKFPEGGYAAMTWEEVKNFLVSDADRSGHLREYRRRRRCRRSGKRCECRRRSNRCSTTPRPRRRSSTRR